MKTENGYTFFESCDITIRFKKEICAYVLDYEYYVDKNGKGTIAITVVYNDNNLFNAIPEGSFLECFYANENGKCGYAKVRMKEEIGKSEKASWEEMPSATRIFNCEVLETFHEISSELMNKLRR